MATRTQTIQAFLDFYDAPRYLEIGAGVSDTFQALRAGAKTSVNPLATFDAGERQQNATYLDLSSDAYFASLDRSSPMFDVIYLDGVHTFEQTLRDLLVSIDYLYADGVLIIDDVIPTSYHASLPSVQDFETVWKVSGTDGNVAWMGDVYRLVFFIESFLPAFAYATVADNHGQLVMWRGRRDPACTTRRRVRDVAALEYRDVIVHAGEFNRMPLAAIVQVCQDELFPPEPVAVEEVVEACVPAAEDEAAEAIEAVEPLPVVVIAPPKRGPKGKAGKR